MTGRALLALAVIGCTADESIGELRPPLDPTKLDVLFVIDNSDSMRVRQELLVAAFPRFLAELATLPGGLPGLHIGVLTTYLGSGPFDYSNGGCHGGGQAGELQSTPHVAGCAPPAGPFIIDEIAADADRQRNYEGDLSAAFACIAAVGESGCGWEQPLGSLDVALAAPSNAGFLREDAFLAIVFLTDEDDCSAVDPAAPDLYDPDTSRLGSAGDRCWRYGLICDGGAPAGPATYHGCTAAPGNGVELEVAGAVRLLKSRKDLSAVDIAVVAGDPSSDVTIDINREMVPSCSRGELAPGQPNTALPALRLAAFAEAFPRHIFQSICDDPDAVLAAVGAHVRETIVNYRFNDPTNLDPSHGCALGGRGGGAWLVLGLLAFIGFRMKMR